MTAETWTSSARRSRARAGRALALMLAALALTLAGATPAGAVAGPVTVDGGAPGGLNVVAIVGALCLAVAIGASVVLRDRISRDRAVRRFRAQLATADVVGAVSGPRPKRDRRLG